MHGTNKRRPFEKSATGQLQVQDIWPTLQGEGPFAGMPAIFIRLTGCNLACTFCDTKWDDEKDKYMDVEDVYSRVNEINYREERGRVRQGKYAYWFEYKLVVLTGGEPARQDLRELIDSLVEGGTDGYQVQVETAGTYWQDIFAHPRVTLVCSPKTKHVHPKIKEHCNHWKYVIQNGHASTLDGLPAGSTQAITREMIKSCIAPDLFEFVERDNPAMLEPGGLYHMVTAGAKFSAPARPPERDNVTVWLSPCDEGENVGTTKLNHRLVGELCMKYGYRATVQLHKYLELP